MKTTEELWKEIDNTEFDVNDWGSCQYSGALGLFNKLKALQKEVGKKKALEALGLNGTYKGIAKDKSVKDGLEEVLKEQMSFLEKDEEDDKELKKYLDDGTEPYDKEISWWYDMTPEGKKECCEKSIQGNKERRKEIANLRRNGFDNCDKILNFLRSCSWDLWSAAQFVANLVFDDLKIEEIPTAPGAGPIINILVQNENYTTGLYCWLLMEAGLVKEEDSFADFDT